MNCPRCSHTNSASARFCAQCAAPLARRCAGCDAPAEAEARFCIACGEPLAASAKPALEDERKQVTILFADIKDSYALVAGHDPEFVRQVLLNPVLDRMINAIRHYGGVLHNAVGDGVMAIFGAPLAVEDHAVRACFAGLRMQEEVAQYAAGVRGEHGVELAIRVGIASGEIIGLSERSAPHSPQNVVGETTWLASRMEQLAAPGAVLVSSTTQQMAEGYVALRSLGPVEVKGIVAPVEVFEVTGPGAAKNRLQVSAWRGLTRFVGREREQARLERALQRAALGQSGVVTIVGEAGVGKSRLTHEFVHSAATDGWLVLEGSFIATAQASAYHPIIELLRQYVGLAGGEAPRTIREKVTAAAMALDPPAEVAIPALLDLLEALEPDDPFRALDPPVRRERTYAAVLELLLVASRQQPVIVVIEDLHWHDALTLGLLQRLASAAAGARLLLVLTTRPNYDAAWESLPGFRAIRLEPLAGESLAALLDQLLGPDPSLAALKPFLIARANGNPFFVEELVRRFVEQGVLGGERGEYRLLRPASSIEVPPTVRAVLAARIDALPAIAKRLLQVAAVIGEEVPLTLLQAVSGEPHAALAGQLAQLQAAEFLLTTQLFPERQFAFKHALTHDVAYGGMLRERRREIHGTVVERMEAVHAERLDQHVERLAHHAVQGELHGKAAHYLHLAGRKAAARSALGEARGSFEQALQALAAQAESQGTLERAFDIHLELRRILRQAGEGREMLQQLTTAAGLAERLQDQHRLGQVYAQVATVHSSLGELDEAVANGERALAIAGSLGDTALRIVGNSNLQQALYLKAEHARVIDLTTETLAALANGLEGEFLGMAPLPAVYCRAYGVMSLAETGRFAEAAILAREAMRLAEPTEHLHTIGWAYFGVSGMHMMNADWTQAALYTEPLVALLRSGNVPMLLPWAVAASALVQAERGDAAAATARIAEAVPLLAEQAERGIYSHRGWALAALARACLKVEQLDQAEAVGADALAATEQQPGARAHAWRVLGDLAAHPRRRDRATAERHYHAALTIGRRHGMGLLQAHCHHGLGALLDAEAAAHHRATAATLFMSMARPLPVEPA